MFTKLIEKKARTCVNYGYNCCSCGDNNCGCAYCYDCNTCEACKNDDEDNCEKLQ